MATQDDLTTKTAPPASRWRLITVMLAGGSLTLLGMVVMVGWKIHNALLIQILPTFTPMQINTALGFFLCGVALLGIVWHYPSLTAIGGGYAVVVGLLTLIEYVWGVNVGIDQLLTKSSIMIGVSHPGRMAPNTALCFLLAGIALILMTHRVWRRRYHLVVSSLGIVVAAGGLAAGLGYLFHVSLAYGWWHLTRMAAHTASGFIMLGLALSVCAQDEQDEHGTTITLRWNRNRGLILSFIVLAVSLVLTLAAWQYALFQLNRELENKLQQQVSHITESLNTRMHLYIDRLEGFAGLFAASPHVGRDNFETYFRRVHTVENSPGLIAISFVERVSANDKAAFLERVRSDRSVAPEGYPTFSITPEGDREEYFVANYIEPYHGNESAHGYDLRSETQRLTALEHARDNDEPTLSGSLTFLIKPHPVGAIIALPIYRNGMVHTTVDQRRAALIGFICGGIQLQEFLTSVLTNEGIDAQVDVEVFDGPVLSEEHLLFDRDGVLRIHESHRHARFQIIQALTIGGRIWTLSFTALPGFGWDTVRQYLPLAVVAVGVLLSLLLFGVLSSMATARDQATVLAQRMTSDLRESQHRYATLIASAPDPIITLSLVGQFESINPAAEEVFGYREEELIGKHFTQTGIIKISSLPKVVQEFGFAMAGIQRMPFELEIVKKDGTRRTMEANPCPVKLEGRVVSIQVIFRDITERKQLEEERLEQAQELEQRNRELVHQQRLMQSLLEDVQQAKERVEVQGKQLEVANKRLKELAVLKDEFVAKVSHELRTPLTAIKEGVSLLLDNALGQTTADQQDFLKTMDGDIDRLTELINNMLDISKIEAGRMRLVRARTVVAELLATMKRSHDPLLGHRTVRIECGEAAPDVFVDPNRMLQVFNNLFSNAIKFTEDDGAIVFRVTQQNGTVSVAVQDNGPGISPEELPKLFKKFSQVGTQGVGRPRGTGLGLALCKELTELHGGRVEVASEVGRGTTFTVSLPTYSDARALAWSFQDLLEHAPPEEAQSASLIAVKVEELLHDEVEPTARRHHFERLVEEIRQHVHRGDNLLALCPTWIVILALTDAKGAEAMVRRLRDTVPDARHLQFATALFPTDGTDIDTLLAVAQTKVAS